LVLKEQVVETTLPCDCYFGYRLTREEAVEFAKSTLPDLVERLRNR
jgi:hypothetical protein